MPAVQLTPNEKEFYRRECVTNENTAAETWKKHYSDRLSSYDALYKHIPSMQRCISGINTVEGLEFVETGGLKAEPRPKSVTVHEMSQKSYLNRPKSGSQKVGYGGLGVHSDYIDPSRAADTIYERDYCVRLDEFRPHIRGVNKTKTSLDGPWRKPGEGTMAVIPTKWQFPHGVKQPEGFLVRSELRKLRLEKEENERKLAKLAAEAQIRKAKSSHELKKDPMLKSCFESTNGKSSHMQQPPLRSQEVPEKRSMMRVRRPVHSRSWAPTDNRAPHGWYKTATGPAKLVAVPGGSTVLNTPQARLNVLKRRLDQRAVAMGSV
ncbi:uncharacterized protein [Watersipora subatra]|uniref:uncharacterized protein isoform X2 n=1 Tax=Watersipora subatra TaxID=2589382 RepID=UPI00355C9814